MLKNDLFEKKGLSAVLVELKCKWLQTGRADLEKHQKFGILLEVDFHTFLKNHDF